MLDCHSRHLSALTVSTVNCSLLAEQDKKRAPALALKEETISFIISTHISLYTCERHSSSSPNPPALHSSLCNPFPPVSFLYT